MPFSAFQAAIKSPKYVLALCKDSSLVVGALTWAIPTILETLSSLPNSTEKSELIESLKVVHKTNLEANAETASEKRKYMADEMDNQTRLDIILAESEDDEDSINDKKLIETDTELQKIFDQDSDEEEIILYNPNMKKNGETIFFPNVNAAHCKDSFFSLKLESPRIQTPKPNTLIKEINADERGIKTKVSPNGSEN